MPPKVKTTKEDIINTAIKLTRQSGAQSLNARTLASELECSTQPIFSNFSSMEELRFEVIKSANRLCSEYINREIASGQYPKYKASGMAYIRFAKEEKELFKLLYMRDRTNEAIPESDELNDKMYSMVQNNTGLSETDAKLFHLEMWACVHGIASMVATNFINLEWELISRILSDTYVGLCKRYGME